MRTRLIFLSIAAIIVVLGVAGYAYLRFMPVKESVVIPSSQATSSFQYEVVTTPAAQERGLGGRSDIPHDYGMLFAFPNDQKPGFWMKDMLTDIDMIWITADGKIVQINDSVAASTYPEVFYPPQPIRYVLETRAGEAKVQGWNVGSVIPLPAPY